MENDPTKMVTTGETQSNEEPEMIVDNEDTSPSLMDTGLDMADDPFSSLKALLKPEFQEDPTSIKTTSTASVLPAHVETRRLAIPLSPKQVNVPEQRPNRSFLRDEIKLKHLTNGEENDVGTKEVAQVESKSLVTSVTKPKASAMPDVFGGVDGGLDHKLATSTMKPLSKTGSTNSVRATFVKPALPNHSSLRGPTNPSETLRNSSTKKAANTLNAKPSVFYDAPTETTKTMKRTASMSLMDSTLSASASRDTSIIALRKKRRIEDPVIVPSHGTAETGKSRNKGLKAEQSTTRLPAQKTADRHQLEDYKKSYTKAFPSFIFLFEIDLDKAQVRELKDQIRRLGGVSAVYSLERQHSDLLL